MVYLDTVKLPDDNQRARRLRWEGSLRWTSHRGHKLSRHFWWHRMCADLTDWYRSGLRYSGGDMVFMLNYSLLVTAIHAHRWRKVEHPYFTPRCDGFAIDGNSCIFLPWLRT